METTPKHAQKAQKSSTPTNDFCSPRTSLTPGRDGLPRPQDSPQKSPGSAKRLKSFFQDLQRESRHALTNKKAKIVQLWEGRRWRRMSLEEVEPFAEMEEKELSSYGATELMECNANYEKTNYARHRGAQTDDFVVENRCWLISQQRRQSVILSQKASRAVYLFLCCNGGLQWLYHLSE